MTGSVLKLKIYILHQQGVKLFFARLLNLFILLYIHNHLNWMKYSNSLFFKII